MKQPLIGRAVPAAPPAPVATIGARGAPYTNRAGVVSFFGMFATKILCPALWMLGLAGGSVAHPDADFGMVSGADWRPAAGEIVIDSRPLAECKRATLPGARCLPAEDLLGPHRRLPSERDILWLLGTAGLDGSEAVLVMGQDATARDFLAGLLFLAGQRSVRVVGEPAGRVLAGRGDAAPGRERGMVREAVFTAPMRDECIVLKHELGRDLAGSGATLLDGRSEAEYWGETVRAARGGHLPGAVLLTAATVSAAAAPPAPFGAGAIAYAHDAYEGLAYFTRLAAGRGLPVRVYPGGWAEWAADGSLPADAVTHPERRVEAATAATPAPAFGAPPAVLALALFLALAAAFGGGWALSRRRAV